PRGSSPDKVDLKLGLDEKSTGSWTFGVGFSQLEKVFIRSSIKQNNFLGKGLSTNLSGDIGARTQNINTSITDPYFLGENISVSLNVFKRQSRFQSITSFKENSFGGGVGIGVPITENTTYNVSYQYSRNNIFDIPAGASIFLLAQAGTQTTGELVQSLTWDTRNSFLTPTSGSLLSGSFGVAGVGGSSRFVTSAGRAASYFKLADGIIFNPSAEARYIRGYNGQAVPIYRLISLGGIGSVRGFDSSGISIRDPVTNDLIGGNKSAFVNLYLFFPLPYMRTSGFRGVSFVDMGDVADFNQTLSFSKARISTGFGIEWISPIGPIGLSWAFVLRDRQNDIRKKFEFALGSTF
ncbi:MAG: BamA/TamA family outer membrane protein, partial [Mariprofundaceae bacterium]|nr:BamA/TamA family outer membrane protein [Mariprofundaceae bacterium]